MELLKKQCLPASIVIALLIGLVGIMNVETSYAASKKIHVKKTTISLVASETYQQKLIGASGKTIKASKVKWKSSNTSIAKISSKGKVTAVTAGTAKMTAKYKGKTYKFTVKVSVSSQDGDKPITVKPKWTISCKQPLPISAASYYSAERVMTMAQIDSIQLTPADNNFTIEVTGTMLMNDFGGGLLLFRVFDEGGNVIMDGDLNPNAPYSGLKFTSHQKCYLTEDPQGSYTFEFYDYYLRP